MRVFVTGASGWIGSAVVPELINAGHHVIGLARSETSAAALAEAGAEVARGDLDDLDTLASTAAASDGVIHLAFKHEEAFSGNFEAAAEADRRAIETFGAALGGRPFVIASGLAGHGNGAVVTEEDQPDPNAPAGHRTLSERAALALSGSSVRLPPTVHGEGDHGFTATLVQIAHDTGVSGYIGDGSNTWPAVHRSDAARVFRLALEAPAGSVLHAVAEEGVPTRVIAAAISERLGVPVQSAEPDHFGWLGTFFALDIRASSARTRELLGWQPAGPGLIADLDAGRYG
jgi:nucleoside-diphosphate-sugar epimerase